MSNCNTKNCCVHGIDLVVKCYDPQPEFREFTIPTFWFNRCNGNLFLLKEIDDQGNAVWIDITSRGSAIDQILTECGEILPTNGQVKFKQGLGIVFACDGSELTFNLDIPIITEYGGTGYTQYTVGDLLVGNINGTLDKLTAGQPGQVLSVKDDGTLAYIDIAQKLACDGITPTENAFPRWNADGKCLKDGKTIQDDDGNNITSVVVNDGVVDRTRNRSNASSADAIKESFAATSGGRPLYRWTKNAKQVFDAYIDRNDSSFKIDGTNLEDPTQMGNFLRINTKGNVTHPFQWQVLAILTEDTGNINSEVEYYLGQETPLTIIENQGGFFSAGGGSVANAAKFTIFEPATFLVYLCAVVSRNGNNQVEIQSRIKVLGSQTRSTGFINIIPTTFGKNSCSVLGGVKGLPGDIINFTVKARSGGNTWFISRDIEDTYTTFIGIYCLG